jgi:hypothetical protein
MGTRAELHEVLKDVLGSDNVYFQPPPTIQMSYPCIVYSRDDIQTDFSNNYPYTNKTRYSVTVIDRNPDSSIPGDVAKLQMCSYDRFYVADNLNHDAFKLFF